jgi:opine dehydrogenase
MAPCLLPGQMVVLMSGGTGAALEFRAAFLEACGRKEVLIAEATTTVVNSRPAGPGKVEILGEKKRVEFAALPATETPTGMRMLERMPFVAVSDVLSTSVTNFAASVHAVPMVLNAAWLEDKPAGFLYYLQGISPSVARVIEQVEAERMELAAALGVETTSLHECLVHSLGALSGDLYTSIHECAIYGTVPAPEALDHRYLWEDTMTGVVPLVGLGRVLGVPTPLLSATLTFASALLGRDLEREGRTLERLGLAGLDARGIRQAVRGPAGK